MSLSKSALLALKHPKTKRGAGIGVALLFGLFLVGMTTAWFTFGPLRPLVPNLPSLIGIPAPKTYLIALQNNSELRPGGGFISAFAIAKVWMGIPSIETFDSYVPPVPNHEITPPYPLSEILSTDKENYHGWQVRDANFSPDFPTSAKQMIDLYRKSEPKSPDFDGVIAIDFTAFEAFLATVGPITMNNEQITPENFFWKSQIETKNIDLHDREALKNRKNMLQTLIPAFLKKMANPFRWEALTRTANSVMQEKHLLLWFADTDLEEKIAANKWSGEFTAPTESGSDALGLSVANIGGRKGDRYIERSIDYHVDFDAAGRGTATATVTIKHNGTKSLVSDFYQAWVQLFTASGSELLDSSVKMKAEQALGFQTFGTLVKMFPGEERVLKLSWRLPKSITSENYRLLLRKQPGQWSDVWRVSLTAPTDHIWSSPDFSLRENVAMWQEALYQDFSLSASLGKDTTPPIAVWQRFTDEKHSEIEVNFSEEISTTGSGETAQKTPFPLDRLQLSDLNHADAMTDSVKIEEAWLDGQNLRMRVSSVSGVKNEWYRLTIRDLFDTSRNETEPNPLELTVVAK